MKLKILFIIPLILAILCLTPFALYKDSVGFSGKTPVFDSLAPSSWKLLEFNVSISATPTVQSGDSAATATAQPSNPPLTTGASYKGFPFGAYFSSSQQSKTNSSSSSSDVSGWSWLWVAVDAMLILITLLLAMKLNRRSTSQQLPSATTPSPIQTYVNPTPAPVQTITPQTVPNAYPPASVTYSANPSQGQAPQPVYPPNTTAVVQPEPSAGQIIQPTAPADQTAVEPPTQQ